MYDALAYIQQLEQINADFAERMARLETQVGKDTNVPSWISVDERLPRHRDDTKNPEGFVYAICKETEDLMLIFWTDLTTRKRDFSYWTPLFIPEPPKEG